MSSHTTIRLTTEQVNFLVGRLHEAASHADGEASTLTTCREILLALGTENSKFFAGCCEEWIDRAARPNDVANGDDQ